MDSTVKTFLNSRVLPFFLRSMSKRKQVTAKIIKIIKKYFALQVILIFSMASKMAEADQGPLSVHSLEQAVIDVTKSWSYA